MATVLKTSAATCVFLAIFVSVCDAQYVCSSDNSVCLRPRLIIGLSVGGGILFICIVSICVRWCLRSSEPEIIICTNVPNSAENIATVPGVQNYVISPPYPPYPYTQNGCASNMQSQQPPFKTTEHPSNGFMPLEVQLPPYAPPYELNVENEGITGKRK